MKIEIFDGSEDLSFFIALRNICAEGNIGTTVEPPITDPGLVGPLPFTALKTLTDLALLYSLY